jgi:succinate dehydrogenase/fumarate reductase flavoprotein subunit
MSPERLNHLFSGHPDEALILSTGGGAHYSCGGIRVTSDRRASLEGLYAAGEVAGGTFGSARLGGSAIADIIVSGYRAGRQAAETAASRSGIALEEEQVNRQERRLEGMLDREGISPDGLQREIRRIMWEKAGPVRREAGLLEALEEMGRLREAIARMGIAHEYQLRDAVETGFMLDAGEVIVSAALARKESRGAHWRLDYPEPDNRAWLQNIIITRSGEGRPALKTSPVAMTRITTPGPCKVGTRWTWGYVGR